MLKRLVAFLLSWLMLFSIIPESVLASTSESEVTKRTEASVKEEDNSSIPADAIIPADAEEWLGHYYKVYNAVMSPSEAAAFCKSLGGYLVTITSQAEKNMVQNLVKNQSSWAKGYYISEINKTGDGWTWATGEPFEYRYWAAYWNYGYGNGGNGWYAGEKLGYLDDNVTPVSHHYMCFKFALDESESTGEFRYNYFVSSSYRTYLGKTNTGCGEEEFCEDINKYNYGFICEWGNPINIETAEASLSYNEYTYNGSVLKPTLTLKYQGVSLEENYDYSYIMTNNVNIGTAKILITGKGRYKDSKTVTFKINPAKVQNVTATLNGKTSMKINWDPVEWGNATKDLGYHVEWSNTSSFSEDNLYAMDVPSDQQECIINYLNGNTTYYFRVSAYAYAGENIGSASNYTSKRTGNAFSYYQYQANYYKNNLMSTSENNFKNISPAKTIYDIAAESDKDFSINCWKAWTTVLDTLQNPASLPDKVFEKKDMYEALIFSIMECSVDVSDIEGMDTETISIAEKMYSQLKATILAKDHIDIAENNSWANLSHEQKEEILVWSDEWLNKELGFVGNVSEGISLGLNALNYINQFQDWCYFICNCLQMRMLTDSAQSILYQMYAKCPETNTTLKKALFECLSIIEKSSPEFIAEMLGRGALLVGKNAMKVFFDKFWGYVKKECPQIEVVWLSYNGGKLLSNTLFGADSIAEKYCRLEAFLDLRSIIWEVYSVNKSGYLSSQNEITAELFLNSTDLLFRCMDLDCEYSLGFIDSVDENFRNKLLKSFGKDTMTELRSSIISIKNSTGLQHDGVLADWVYQLENDYPDWYEKYKYLIKDSVGSASIAISEKSFDFDGTSKEPSVIVSCSGKKLSKNVDYTVSYVGNVSAGTAMVLVQGIGNYRGTVSETFIINAPSMEYAVVTIPDCEFDGGQVKAPITVTYKGKMLVEGIDYTVEYENNNAIGTATATIVGFGGNSIGTITKTFNIIKKKEVSTNTGNGTAGSSNNSQINNGTSTISAPRITSVKNSSSKKILVKWKKVNGVSGYQIQYALNGKYKKAKTVTINKPTTISKKLNKLKKGKKYYIRMRAYKSIDGKKYYSVWSKSKKVKVKK